MKKVRDEINSQGTSSIFNTEKKRGAKTKIDPEIIAKILRLTYSDRRINGKLNSDLINQTNEMKGIKVTISKSSVYKVKHDNRFFYGPPIQTFLLNDEQKKKRVEFCNSHLSKGTNWDNVIFTDESTFVLGDDKRWLWRIRGEHCPEVCLL